MEPYPHQAQVYDLLADRKNVILRAPTGSGKTQAAVFPFLAAMDPRSDMHYNLPHKCIYSVPMRVLAKQFRVAYGETVHRYRTRWGIDMETAIQTGDMPEDPELRRNLIFATIDQTLSSFLMHPYGLSRGRSNLNLGAILSSYLVFDEFHLYDPDSTLPTALQMLRLLNGITPFVLMTATFSEALIGRLATQLNAEIVGLSPADRISFAALGSQAKTRRYHVATSPLFAGRVLEAHTGRTIVICNTVARARAMAAQLQQAAPFDTEVILLHSQFLREDRDRIEDRVREQFGKENNGSGSTIVIATQAIEVGVDITSTVMHTELAPANAIIQRAGRCARYEGNTGDVYIYRHTTQPDGEPIDLFEKSLPYDGRHRREQMRLTYETFEAYGGSALTYDDEQAVIDAVHTPADIDILNALRADAGGHRRSMFAAMRGESEQVGQLVRHVLAQPVTIHDNPRAEDVLANPYKLPSFSLHPGSLRGFVTGWLRRYHDMDDGDAPPFGVLYLHAETDPDDSRNTLYRWEPVGWDAEKERITHLPYGALVVVHPALATYHPERGFLPDEGGAVIFEPPPKQEWERDGGYTYRLETYAEHIQLVYKAAFEDDPEIGHRAYWGELDWGAHRLAEKLNLPYADLCRAAELAVLLHDVGKLSTGWQGWVRKYQAKIGKPTEPGEAYAHTDRTTAEHREIEKTVGRRPPHAVESAIAASPTIATLPQELRQAVFTAISRHHGAFTDGYTPVQLESFALTKVNETTDGAAQRLLDGRSVPQLPPGMFVPLSDSQVYPFMVYALLARLLRRSDVRGTIWNTRNLGSNSNDQ